MTSPKFQDYSGFFGRNIISQESEDKCPFKEMPKDAKDYAVYRKYWESEIESTIGNLNSGIMKCSAKCEAKDPKTGNVIRCDPAKEGHMGAGFVGACNHIIVQDPVNPEGVYYVPYIFGDANGYFVCATCFKLMEQKKFDHSEDVKAKCVLCISEAIEGIIRLKPDRFIDLRGKK